MSKGSSGETLDVSFNPDFVMHLSDLKKSKRKQATKKLDHYQQNATV